MDALMVRAVVALERIAAALDRAMSVDHTETGGPSIEDAPPCLHPPESRIDFGGMGESEGFQCRDCGAQVAPVPLSAGG